MSQYDEVKRAWRYVLGDIRTFSRVVMRRQLREYQLRAAAQILDSVFNGKGESFVVMMSRQAGKNEMSAQLEAYLMNLYRRKGESIVKASPTYKPQTINSILRLSDRMRNRWNASLMRRREGHIVELDTARAFFFSAEPNANVVGATASMLLEGDEAQDINESKWAKDFVPMGASTNVTTVLYGTAWTSNTFLAQTESYLREQQAKDGYQRVFKFDCDVVGDEVPDYRTFVLSQVERYGRDHPLIKTQYYLETIDGEGGLFSEGKKALMRGGYPRITEPVAGHRYLLLVDVGGEDEEAGTAIERSMLANPKRDATAVTIVDLVIDRTAMPAQRIYRTVDRQLYIGRKHTSLHQIILAQARHWGAIQVVVDATGVGQGLASFLTQALGERVVPVIFTPKVKSDIGWGFLAIVETGRYQEYQDDGAADTRQFWYEVGACEYEVRPGPQRMLRWGVWSAPTYNGLVAQGHDDALVSAALCAIVDAEPPNLGMGESISVDAYEDMDTLVKGRWD